MNVQKPEFISLWRAVEGIATHISPPEIGPRGEKDQAPAWFLPDHEAQTQEGSVSEPMLTMRAFLFKHSKAVDVLLSAIDVLPKYAQPAWLDIEHGMGAPKATPQAEPEGRRILSLWIRAFDDWDTTYFAWLYNRERPEPVTTDPYLRFVNMGTYSGANGIGFIRPVLARLLDQSGIAHSFGSCLTSPEHETHNAGNVATTAPQFRGPMAEVLTMAWESARDRSKARSVLAALAELARRPPIPSPLVEASDDGQEVKWLDDDGRFQTFDIEDMRSRMRGANKPRT